MRVWSSPADATSATSTDLLWNPPASIRSLLPSRGALPPRASLMCSSLFGSEPDVSRAGREACAQARSGLVRRQGPFEFEAPTSGCLVPGNVIQLSMRCAARRVRWRTTGVSERPEDVRNGAEHVERCERQAEGRVATEGEGHPAGDTAD